MKNAILFLLIGILFITGFLRAQNNDWQKVYTSSTVINIQVSSNKTMFAAIGSAETGYPLYRSTSGGTTWESCGLNNYHTESILCTPSGNVFVSVVRNGPGQHIVGIILRSSDNGVTWDSTLSTTNSDAVALAITSQRTLLAGMSDGGLARSTNNGNDWTWTSFPSPFGNHLLATQNNVIFAERDIYNGGFPVLARSTDDGFSWTLISNSGSPQCFHGGVALKIGLILILSPEYCPTIHTTGGIYRTSDSGVTWIKKDLPQVNNSIMILNNRGHIFVGGGGYVSFSSNNGDSWIPMSSGSSPGLINCLAIDSSGYLFAGTASGIFRTTYSTTFIRENNIGKPTTFYLEQNFPNPFNPSTIFKFHISTTSLVTLKIFDLLGRDVETLLNSEMKAGKYEIPFDGNELASGIYLYRLQSGDLAQTRKFLLLR